MSYEENTHQIQCDAYNMKQKLVMLSARFNKNGWKSYSAFALEVGEMIQKLATGLAEAKQDLDEASGKTGSTRYGRPDQESGGVMTEGSHQRRCGACGNVAEHTDSITPWVLCGKCGSQDTRRG